MKDLKKALDTKNKNDFKRAFKILSPIAESGNVSANFYKHNSQCGTTSLKI